MTMMERCMQAGFDYYGTEFPKNGFTILSEYNFS